MISSFSAICARKKISAEFQICAYDTAHPRLFCPSFQSSFLSDSQKRTDIDRRNHQSQCSSSIWDRTISLFQDSPKAVSFESHSWHLLLHKDHFFGMRLSLLYECKHFYGNIVFPSKPSTLNRFISNTLAGLLLKIVAWFCKYLSMVTEGSANSGFSILPFLSHCLGSVNDLLCMSFFRREIFTRSNRWTHPY